MSSRKDGARGRPRRRGEMKREGGLREWHKERKEHRMYWKEHAETQLRRLPTAKKDADVIPIDEIRR